MGLLRGAMRSLVGMAVFVVAGLAWAVPPSLAAGPESVAALAGKLSPAVVNIATTMHVPYGQGAPYPELPEGSPLKDLFDQLNPNQGQGEEREQEASSLGSGFIVSADGLIVTNNHVIDGAEDIQVYLTDGTRLPAKLVGADDKMDLAVLKVEAGRPLDFVEFGDSDSAEVGDWVMAIGNPFGLGGSVTLGIVSARNRDINAGPYDNFIQTDAAINQGNSGGPLFDMDGKVVGINTAIIARGGSSLGIGFAVPVNLARPVIEQLEQFGETRRGWLGVGIQDVTEDIAASLGRDTTNGAMVVEITAGGPADGTLQVGDVILEFDGRPIPTMRALPRLVAATDVGKATVLKVLRAGEEITLNVTLGRLEQPVDVADTPSTQGPKLSSGEALPLGTLPGLVGFDVSPLDETNRAEYDLSPDIAGVLVTAVVPGSDAEDKGFITGLVISEVNQQPISTTDEVRAIVSTASDAGRPAVLFKVTDPAGSSRFIAVRLDKKAG